MILNDEEIRARIANDGLISHFADAGIGNCGYTLRVGEVFLPETGDRFVFGGGTTTVSLTYTLGPAETVVVMTEESLRMPADLMASFWGLNRRSMQGALLINGSILEPHYEGPLSCYLVNFSSQPIVLKPGDPIGKLCFHRTTAPTDPKPLRITTLTYQQDLAEKAQRLPKTFVGISTILSKAEQAAKDEVTKTLKWGGGIVVFLLAWATLQPLFTNWIWKITNYDKVIDAQRKLDEATKFDVSPVLELKHQVKKLQDDVEQLRKRGP